MTDVQPLKAIDLYSGIGGWSLGLRLSGIEVVASYERWEAANETNLKNNRHKTRTTDIRQLSFSDLPDGIDVVVGSPPCTQFSFSNRGGSGNLEDGLEDIITFLEIVDHLKPKMWAMENVPRVAPIIAKELERGGRLHRFAHLGIRIQVLNMEEFGVPQRRKRCIAGNFDVKLLQSYVPRMKRFTLGDVVDALECDPVRDPLFGISIAKSKLVDHVPEAPLNSEELRINRANKTAHTVYNAMPFPDRMERAVRTITATCTRVSRESIVIRSQKAPESVRRLTIRERASLQGFPITYQFFGSTYSQKIKMVGNAVPPAFSYLMGHAFQATSAEALPALDSHSEVLSAPASSPAVTPPDRPGSTYPLDRSFRFAIQSLQLKSGVRFELRNRFINGNALWAVDFYFGTSKDIIALQMDGALGKRLLKVTPRALRPKIELVLSGISTYISQADIDNMQQVWTHKGVGVTRPFMLLDELDRAGKRMVEVLQSEPVASVEVVEAAINLVFGDDAPAVGLAKLRRNAPLVAAGLLIGSVVNSLLQAGDQNGRRRPARQPVGRIISQRHAINVGSAAVAG